jgi:hypothetical protein
VVTVTVPSGSHGDEGEADINIVFEGFEDETIVLEEPVREGNGLTVTAPAGFDWYQWYLDSSMSPTVTTSPTTNLNVYGYLMPGLHYLTVIVDKGGYYFSKTLTFTVGY